MNSTGSLPIVSSSNVAGARGAVGGLTALGLAGLTLLACASPREDELTRFGAQEATAPTLGTAAAFAVLASESVTSIGDTVVTGDLGVAGVSLTGFPPGVVNGTAHVDDSVADQARADASNAYDALAQQACDLSLTGTDLGGLTLVAGTYCFASSAQLTGDLVLDAQGDPNAVFVFQIGSALTTASSATVTLINGGDPCNVFWQVGSSATLGTDTSFIGSIVARASITLNTTAEVIGRALALDASVTMDTNAVALAVCEAGGTTASTSGAGGGGDGGSTSVTVAASVGTGGSDAATGTGGAGGAATGTTSSAAGTGGADVGTGGASPATTAVTSVAAGSGGADGDGGDSAEGGGGAASHTVAATVGVGQGGSDEGTGGAGDDETYCDGVCVDLEIDAANCGACGNFCDALEVCTDGACCEISL